MRTKTWHLDSTTCRMYRAEAKITKIYAFPSTIDWEIFVVNKFLSTHCDENEAAEKILQQ